MRRLGHVASGAQSQSIPDADAPPSDYATRTAQAQLIEADRRLADLSAMHARDSLLRRALMLSDLLAAAATLLIGAYLIVPGTLSPFAALLAPGLVLGAKLIGLYDRDDRRLHRVTLDEAPLIFQLATVMTLCAVISHGVGLFAVPLDGSQALNFWLVLFGCLFLGRTIARASVRRTLPADRCLLVGNERETAVLSERIRSDESINGRLIATVTLDFDGDWLHNELAIKQAILEHRAERMILAPHTTDTDGVLDAIRLGKRMGVKVMLRPRLLDVVGSNVTFDDVQGLTLLGLPRFGLTRSSRALKRTLDIFGAGLGLVLLSPLLLLLAILVLIDGTGGKVLFRQLRVGRDGKQFGMFKFRTMVPDAEQQQYALHELNETEGVFKLTNDPRITRIGSFLRRSSLDELPQLLNVLRGDMSLVGPRPLVIDEDRLVLGWDRRRLHLTPGITGPWQLLSGRRVPLSEMVKIDYIYIGNWSFWGDIKILLRTAWYMITLRGM